MGGGHLWEERMAAGLEDVEFFLGFLALVGQFIPLFLGTGPD
jgi:hypothetical protein